MARARVEERRSAGGEVELRQQVVELDGALVFLVSFWQSEAHGDAHPENLRSL